MLVSIVKPTLCCRTVLTVLNRLGFFSVGPSEHILSLYRFISCTLLDMFQMVFKDLYFCVVHVICLQFSPEAGTNSVCECVITGHYRAHI